MVERTSLLSLVRYDDGGSRSGGGRLTLGLGGRDLRGPCCDGTDQEAIMKRSLTLLAESGIVRKSRSVDIRRS